MLVELEICCTEYPYSIEGASGIGTAGVLEELPLLLDRAPSGTGTGAFESVWLLAVTVKMYCPLGSSKEAAG